MRVTISGMTDDNTTAFCFEFDVQGDAADVQSMAIRSMQAFHAPDPEEEENTRRRSTPIRGGFI